MDPIFSSFVLETKKHLTTTPPIIDEKVLTDEINGNKLNNSYDNSDFRPVPKPRKSLLKTKLADELNLNDCNNLVSRIFIRFFLYFSQSFL